MFLPRKLDEVTSVYQLAMLTQAKWNARISDCIRQSIETILTHLDEKKQFELFGEEVMNKYVLNKNYKEEKGETYYLDAWNYLDPQIDLPKNEIKSILEDLVTQNRDDFTENTLLAANIAKDNFSVEKYVDYLNTIRRIQNN